MSAPTGVRRTAPPPDHALPLSTPSAAGAMSDDQRPRNAEQFLAKLIAGYQDSRVMPAVGAGLVLGNALVARCATGVRRHGTTKKTQPDDMFHLGSVTKPMTGYLIARLIHKGRMSWGRTIGDVFPDLIEKLETRIGPKEKRWSDHYRDTTIVDLMTHTSGADYAPLKETNAAYGAMDSPPHATPAKNQIAKRKLYTDFAIQDRPFAGWSIVGAGAMQKYSGGCIVAAAMAEQIMGDPWGDLMREHVFQPLGMTHVAFDRMSAKTTVTNTWQHRFKDGHVVSSAEPDTSQIHYSHGPAGAICCSVDAFGRFLAALISNPPLLVDPAIWQQYVNPPAGLNFSRGGWSGNGVRLAHEGSNNWNHSVAIFDLGKRMGVFAFANIETDESTAALREIAAELEGMGDAWDAVGVLHQAVGPSALSVSATSVWDTSGTYAASRMIDDSFVSRWASKTTTPTVTLTLAKARTLKGVVLCQAIGDRIQTFEIEIHTGTAGAAPTILSGAALAALTTRSANGLVIQTAFATPTKAKTVKVRVKSASGAPTVSRLLLLEYVRTAAQDFDIDASNRLWVVDDDGRVLASLTTVDEPAVVLARDTAGVASAVRKAGSPAYVIGTNKKVWKTSSAGWVEIPDSVTSKRIAVDADNTVWSISASNRIRRHDGTKWVEHPGTGVAKDLCVRNGTPYVVGSDDYIYRGTSSVWQKVPGASPRMRRIAVDAASGKLWALDLAGRVHSYDAAADKWTEHPGGGVGRAIVVHAGVPYVIGTDDGVWRSAGSAGWKRLTVLQDKPA